MCKACKAWGVAHEEIERYLEQEKMGPYSSNLIDIALQIVGETEKAWKVTDGERTVWLPKRYVEHDPDNHTFAMPTWLAEEKELV